jgi:hypothetical protein
MAQCQLYFKFRIGVVTINCSTSGWQMNCIDVMEYRI